MLRDKKSERSRRQVLDAALNLFAHHGFGATRVREIAAAAGVSTGNVYHHFPDKESIFRELLDEHWKLTESLRYPYTRALGVGLFPDNLEQLAQAARDSVQEYRQYVALIYVDVIEFEGTHIRRFYGESAHKFAEFLEKQGLMEATAARLRPGVSPVSALLLATRFFFNYFSVQILFGVPEPFGKNSAESLAEIVDLLRNGMV